MTKDTLESFSNKINSKFLFDYDLKKSNWFNIGGKAKGYFKPDTLDDLVLFLKKFGRKERVFVLGAGSNILMTGPAEFVFSGKLDLARFTNIN